MPITPPVSTPVLDYTCVDLITDALIEIGAMSPGDALEPAEGQWAFRKLNYLIDVWQAMRKFVWGANFQVFTFQAGVNPVIMGPSPAATPGWTVPTRPVRIESAALILNSGTAVDLPINIRDKDWWALNQVKSIQTNVPTDLYPDYLNPDAYLYFWPVMNQGDQVRIQLWQTVTQFNTITDPIGGADGPGTLPQAYRAALMLTLAESLLPGENRQAHPVLVQAALQARTAVFGNNSQPPRIRTQDSGMPRSGAIRADFNWATGGRAGGPPE